METNSFKPGDKVHYDGSACEGDVPEDGVVDEVGEDGLLMVTTVDGEYREWDVGVTPKAS